MASEDDQGNAGIRGQLLNPGHELSAGAEKNDERAPSFEQPAETESAASELEELERERDRYRERLTRLQAEFDNAQKRTERERREWKKVTLADALRSLLPVSDNFERAMQAPVNSSREFRSGMRLIQRQFEEALRKLGLTPIPTKGEIFDPRVHEAVDVIDTAEAEDGRILEELQRGYKLGDQLVRPALVRVARNQHRRL
jgi:molecular chaperone GrpE